MNKFYGLKDILLITPPFTQLNTPYPATAYLKGFLNTKNIDAFQIDLGIEVILELFSKNGLTKLFKFAALQSKTVSKNSKRIASLQQDYVKTVDDVMLFLQGQNQTLAYQICNTDFLPKASRFKNLDDIDWAFGVMGFQDKAKHLATLYLEDLSDFIVECVDENFGFSRYAEKLGRSANSFEELNKKLSEKLSYIDTVSIALLKDKIESKNPKIIGFSVPFPGNLFSAFRCAQFIKANYPSIKIVMGGGFPNTELRSVSDTRVFDFFDFITLDDGELPLELLYKKFINNSDVDLKRTFYLKNTKVFYENTSKLNDYSFAKVGTPDYSDLPLNKYISVIEVANPMHSLWSDGRWNKLTMAHGCYWGKCTFCDISLDYIKNYDPIAASLIVDRMEQLIAQTGETGFHFVDEAAPPALMKEVAMEIIKRKLIVTWWTNIRFEKSFTSDLCKLLQASGCIAVSGGLEVASDRLLKLINKGVTVEQVAKVTHHFTDAGIMVHAYLMYGFPTQTIQETVDSLEMVRQLFEAGVIQSGYWHQFALTAHSPVGLNPNKFHIVPTYSEISFANNDVLFTDKTGIKHDKFSFGLKKSLYNYMHACCFEFDLQEWFDFKIPKTKIPKNFIENCIKNDEDFKLKPSARLIWLGNEPEIAQYITIKKGQSYNMIKLNFITKTTDFEIKLDADKAKWLLKILAKMQLDSDSSFMLKDLKADFENQFDNFELFWFSKQMLQVRQNGLLTL